MEVAVFKKKIITGCEGRGDAQSPYLTRWTIFELPSGSLYIHLFHRSDADVLHCHPWDFWTVVLWRGYREDVKRNNDQIVTRRVYPGAVLFRSAEHTHRVRLHRNTEGYELPAVTLVWRGRYRREWGFWVNGLMTHWREYFKQNGC